MDWDKLRIFHAVATAQSFTRAGDVLNLSQSAISRQIAALEEHLQVALFHRHARGLLLTEQGEILFRTVSDILSSLASAENALLETRERPRGPLKVTAPVALGTSWLVKHVCEFSDLYPDITVTLLIDDRELDLVMREADLAIRLFPARHPDLVQKHLTVLPNSLYAANDYLRRFGVPKKTEDLSKHRLIAYPEDTRLPYGEVNWVLKVGLKESAEPRKPVLKVNSLVGLKKAVECGIGVASLPDYLMQTAEGVTKVLPELKGPTTDVFLIYPVELRNSKRINVFRDFILRKLVQEGWAKADRSHAKNA